MAVVALALLLAWAHPARAQYIGTYFPTSVPGYDTRLGVTVLSRARPEYASQGINVGSFVVRPRLDEAFGYDTDPNGGGNGSLLLRTSPSVSASSNWSRDSLGFSISADNFKYFNEPSEDYTNWTAAVGGSYTIGRGNLTAGYSHLSLNQSASEVGAVQSTTPVHFTVDDVRAGYSFDLGRFSFMPSVDVQRYNFDNTTILDKTVSQAYRDRVVLTGGVSARYSLSDQRNLLFIVQGIDSNYTDQTESQPSNDSTGVLALGGLDYQAEGPWRYQVLGGVEQRGFAASQYKSHVAPIVAADVVWTPTGLTTLTGSVSRTIESASSEGTSGYVYTNAGLTVDHELYRNILLQGRGGYQVAQYLQGGGSQSSYTAGASVNWLLNRNVRVSLDYLFSVTTASQASTVSGSSTPSTNAGQSTRDVGLLAVHLAM